jgi:hypothetical protein
MLTTEERLLLAAIARRAEAVKNHAELCLRQESAYVPSVLGFVSWTLIKTLFLLCGAELRSDACSWLFAKLQDDHGLCDICGKLKNEPTDIACPECLAQFESEDREIAIISAMDQPTRGKPA